MNIAMIGKFLSLFFIMLLICKYLFTSNSLQFYVPSCTMYISYLVSIEIGENSQGYYDRSNRGNERINSHPQETQP